MKISPTTPNYINQTYTKQASPATPKDSTGVANGSLSDSLNLSSKTLDLQKISKSMDIQPTDRQEYVSDIKLKVETNQYNINVEAVAEKMAGTLMDEIV